MITYQKCVGAKAPPPSPPSGAAPGIIHRAKRRMLL